MSDDIELAECASCSAEYPKEELAITRGGDIL